MAIESHEQLVVWQESHQLVLGIYATTKKFPQDERFGLTSQMRRSAVSVPANIAEGFKRRSKKDKSHFYNISQGSLEELRYYIRLSSDLKYPIDAEPLAERAEHVGRMLHGLIRSLER